MKNKITFQLIHFNFSEFSNDKINDPWPLLLVKVLLTIFGFIMNLFVLITLRSLLKHQSYGIMMTMAILSWATVDCILCYQKGIINGLISFAITAVLGSLAMFLGFKSKELTPRGNDVIFGMLTVFCITVSISCIISDTQHFPYDLIGAIFLGCGVMLIVYYTTVWLNLVISQHVERNRP
uniref:Uncharacterized protein n=1 Tax=Trichobilharzia regenti TaxID=157069 RepID=A0AA85K5B0_TRIRE|nr:unnamed protein product [Trichobilharzia regenti]